MEVIMDDTQMHRDPYVHNTFWHEDQICITFQLSHTIPSIVLVPHEAAAADEGTGSQSAQCCGYFGGTPGQST